MTTFGTDQGALRDRLRSYLDQECTPAQVRATWAMPSGRSASRWRDLAALGAVGVMVPPEFGGGGHDETWLVGLLEEAGRAALPEALGPVAVAAALLADTGSDAQRQEWLPQIAAGEAIVVASLPRWPLVDDAHIADLVLLTAGNEIHAVPGSAVDRVVHPTTDPSRRQYSVDATLNARSCLMVRAREDIAMAFDRAGLADAALLIGTAGKLLELGQGYCQDLQRSAVGGGLEDACRQLAEAAVVLEGARPAVYRAAQSVAQDVAERTADVEAAHVSAAQAAYLAARAGEQLLVAGGDTGEHDLHLWLHRGLSARILP